MQNPISQVNAKVIKKETSLQTLNSNTESIQVNMRTSVYENFQNNYSDRKFQDGYFLQRDSSFPCLEQHMATF